MSARLAAMIGRMVRLNVSRSEWKEIMMPIPCDICKHPHRFFERQCGLFGVKTERKQTCSHEGCICKRFVYKKRKKLMR